MSPLDRIAVSVGRAVSRALGALAWFGVFHAKTVVALTIVITAASIFLASGLELSTDLGRLLPEDIPVAARMKQLYEEYGGVEPVVIAISGGADVDDRIDLALELQDRLAEHPQLRVVSGMFGENPWAIFEGDHADALVAYLDPQQVEALADRMTPGQIDQAVARNRERLRSPIGPLASRWIAEDPLGLAQLAFQKVQNLTGRLSIDTHDGVLTTEDNEIVLLTARIEGSTHDVKLVRELLDDIAAMAREEIEALGATGWAGIGPGPPAAQQDPSSEERDDPETGEALAADALRVGLTGAPAILVDYRTILARDIRSISGVAIVAVLVLFLLAFRRPVSLFVAAVPLLVGISWTLGFASLTVGELSVFTAGSVAILCGLAIDFTIHLYNRYLEEVHADRNMLDAFRAAHAESGRGIVAAAATTAWAFLAAGMSSFRGLRDLGIVCASGIVLSLIASLLLVPALTSLAARLRPMRDRPRGLASFGLAPVLRFVLNNATALVVVGAIATGLLTWQALRAHLDEDFRRFRPTSAPSIQLQNVLAEKIGTSLQPILALVDGESAKQVVETSYEIQQRWAEFVDDEDGSLAAVFGPASLVPPESVQRGALDALERLRTGGAIDPAAVEKNLLASLARHGFRVDESARRVAGRLRRVLERSEPLTIDEAREGPLGVLLEDMIVTRRDGRLQGIVSGYPRPNQATRTMVTTMNASVAGLDAQLVGGRVLSHEVKPVILREGLKAMIISSLGVLIILLLVFRRPLLVGLTFLPLVVGVIAAVGLMSALGIDFNLVSLSMLPLILGIGIDNGIHVVHRFLHTSEDLVEVFQHTGRGIVMTSVTTMVGFGALIFADYPGLVSSGVLAIIGVGATLVTAVILLPALLELVRVRDLRRQA